MDRSMSASPSGNRSTRHDRELSQTPPWEQRTTTQVPFINSAAKPLTGAEQQALQSLWAGRSNSFPDGQHQRLPTPHRKQSNHSNTSHDSHDAHTSTKGLRSATPPVTIPYETRYVSAGPKTAPNLPSFVQAPPTPPDSFTLSRSSSGSGPNKPSGHPSPPPIPTLDTMPGTMSSRRRERTPSRRRAASSHSEARVKREREKALPFGRRLKTALKDMFKREPIDQSAVEYLKDRHWADDDDRSPIK